MPKIKNKYGYFYFIRSISFVDSINIFDVSFSYFNLYFTDFSFDT